MLFQRILPIVAVACLIQTAAHSQELPLATQLSSGLLKLAEVKEELDLTSEQERKVATIQSQSKEMPTDLIEIAKEIQAKQPEQSKSLHEIIRELMIDRLRNSDETIKSEILVPHQKSRLDQIALRFEMKRIGFEPFLFANLASMSRVNKKEKDKILADLSVIKRKLLRDIQKLRDTAEKEMVDVLDVAMQEEFKEKLGDPFHLSERPSLKRK